MSEKLPPEENDLTDRRHRFNVSTLGLPETIGDDLVREITRAQLDLQEAWTRHKSRLRKETINAQEYRERLAEHEEMSLEGFLASCIGAICDAFRKTGWAKALVKDAADAAIGQFLEDYGITARTRKNLDELLREPPYHWYYRKFLEDIAEPLENKVGPPVQAANAENDRDVASKSTTSRNNLLARRGRPPLDGGKRNNKIAAVALGSEDWKHNLGIVAENLDASPSKPAAPRGHATWLDYFQAVLDKHFKKTISDAIRWSQKNRPA